MSTGVDKVGESLKSMAVDENGNTIGEWISLSHFRPLQHAYMAIPQGMGVHMVRAFPELARVAYSGAAPCPLLFQNGPRRASARPSLTTSSRTTITCSGHLALSSLTMTPPFSLPMLA